MSSCEHPILNMIAATSLGALAGASLGLGACVYIFEQPLLFTGDTVLAGALICGRLGWYFGSGFVDWLKENWWWF